MAKKYIDADRLKAEIEGIRWFPQISSGYNDGREDMKIMVLDIIDSLQQDQPEETCNTCGFYENNCPFIRNTFKPYPNKICKDYTYSVMKKQEQPEVELDNRTIMEEIRKCGCNPNEFDVARHFYELGLKAKEENK